MSSGYAEVPLRSQRRYRLGLTPNSLLAILNKWNSGVFDFQGTDVSYAVFRLNLFWNLVNKFFENFCVVRLVRAVD